MGALGVILGPLGSILCSLLGALGVLSDSLGVILGALGSFLGSFWSRLLLLGASCGASGLRQASGNDFEGILAPFWGHVGVKMASKATLDTVIFGITFLIAFGKDFPSILEGF